MGSTTGSIIITVKGKEVYVGTAPPSSPVDNELWLDISENNVLKYYKASTKTWCVVNDVSEKFGDVYKYLQTNYYTKTETNNAVKEEIGKTTIVKKDGTVVNMKDAINSVIDTATEHTQKIEDINSKYNSVTGEITEVKTSTSEIKQDLNGFKTTVSETYVDKTEFNNMSVGGTNLLLATKNFGKISTSNGDWSMSTDDDGFTVASRTGNGSWIELQTITTIDAKDNPQAGNTLVLALDAKADDLETSPLNYTLALKVYGSNDGFKTWQSSVYTECYVDGSSSRYLKVLSGTRQNDKWCRLSYIVTIPATFNSGSLGTYNEYRYGMGVYVTKHNTGHTLSVRKFKMSFGNVPSDWSPAPEDYETRMSSAESKIEQNADSIKHTVKKDGVISAINQSAEEIAIAAKKISLKGYVSINTDNRKTFEIDESGNVSLDVNSLKIKAGNIEDTLHDLNDSISSTNDYTNKKVDELDEKISTELSNNYIDDDTFNKFKEQLSYQQNITNEGLEERFTSIDNRINNSLAGTNEKVELITKYIRHKDGKLILGEEGSTLVTTIENGVISFTENIDSANPEKVAYISNRKLYITDAEVHLNMILGDPDKSQFAFVPDSNGNLSFMKIS